jgi:hypothetical protein
MISETWPRQAYFNEQQFKETIVRELDPYFPKIVIKWKPYKKEYNVKCYIAKENDVSRGLLLWSSLSYSPRAYGDTKRNIAYYAFKVSISLKENLVKYRASPW